MTTSIIKNKTFRAVLIRLGALLFWLAVWETAALLIGKSLLLPTPVETGKRLVSLASTGTFWEASFASLGRILLGSAIGILLGTIPAVLAAVLPPLGTLLSAPITVIRATPVASFILLVMFLAKTSSVPVVISALMVIPIVWSSVRTGISKIDPSLSEAAKLYRLSPLKRLRLFYIPGVLPYFTSAVVTALGLAWKAGIAAEVISLPKVAIGRYLYQSKLYLETADLFAWTAVVILFSVCIEALLKALLRKGGVK